MRLIDADALLEHIKDIPTWWADEGGEYGPSRKYPDAMFYPEDIVSAIECADTINLALMRFPDGTVVSGFLDRTDVWDDGSKIEPWCTNNGGYMPVQIELKDGQSGYDAVADYIRKYWDHNYEYDAIVSLSLSRGGVDWEKVNAVGTPHGGYCEFLYDWWEGERFITIFGIRNVCELDTIYGGIYK